MTRIARAPIWLWVAAATMVFQSLTALLVTPLTALQVAWLAVIVLVAWLLLRGSRIVWRSRSREAWGPNSSRQRMQHARDRIREMTERRWLLRPVDEITGKVNVFLRCISRPDQRSIAAEYQPTTRPATSSRWSAVVGRPIRTP